MFFLSVGKRIDLRPLGRVAADLLLTCLNGGAVYLIPLGVDYTKYPLYWGAK